MKRIEQVRKLLSDGMFQSAIARQLGISRQRVEQLLHPEKHYERAKRYYNAHRQEVNARHRQYAACRRKRLQESA